jgi:hypothetical protein
MINTVNKLGKEGTFLNITNTIHNKPTAKIILNAKKLKAFVQHNAGSSIQSNQAKKKK